MFKHGDYVTAIVWDRELSDARVSQGRDGQWYICFNEDYHSGDNAPEKFGYNHSRSILESYYPGCELPPTGGRKTKDIRLLHKDESNKEKDNMSTLSKLTELKLTPEKRLLKKYEIVDNNGNLTEEGRNVVLARIFEDKKDEITKDLKELEESEKKACKK